MDKFMELAFSLKAKTPTAAIVRACRKITGLSQAEFAERIGSTRITVQSWEYSLRSTPPLEKFLEMAKLCGISYQVFFETYEALNNGCIII